MSKQSAWERNQESSYLSAGDALEARAEWVAEQLAKFSDEELCDELQARGFATDIEKFA